MHHFHEPAGSNDFDDPATWDRASYTAHPIDEIEPLPDTSSDYRQAAIFHLRLMYAVDDFVTAAPDSRVAVVAVAVVLGWPSARGLSVGNIADQFGCSPSTLTRSIARFKTLAAPDSRRWPGSGFPPAAVFDSFDPVPGRAATSRRRVKPRSGDRTSEKQGVEPFADEARGVVRPKKKTIARNMPGDHIFESPQTFTPPGHETSIAAPYENE
jgi:hypothetical protein